MEASELFRENLKQHLKRMPRGAQSRLADALNIGRKHMNDFLGKRKPLSETKREEIAKHLGYVYERFLAEGRQLVEKTKPSGVSVTHSATHLRRISDRTGEGTTREGIISLFADRETARQMILQLVEIEKVDREHFVAAKSYIHGIFDSLKIKKKEE